MLQKVITSPVKKIGYPSSFVVTDCVLESEMVTFKLPMLRNCGVGIDGILVRS